MINPPSPEQIREEREYAEKQNDLTRLHELSIRRIDLEAIKYQAKLENLWRLPIELIRLPLRILLLIPLIVYAAKKEPVPDKLWELIR